jgi:hypothetical protein
MHRTEQHSTAQQTQTDSIICGPWLAKTAEHAPFDPQLPWKFATATMPLNTIPANLCRHSRATLHACNMTLPTQCSDADTCPAQSAVINNQHIHQHSSDGKAANTQ